MHTAITIATLMVDYIEIHSQGHFLARTQLGKMLKESDLEILTHHTLNEKSSSNLLVSGTLCLQPCWQGQVWIVCLEGVQTRGQSQGHPRRHNEINLSLRCTVATSRRDNNAFNFGLPSILRLCIGAVIAGWLLAHSGCSLAAFPQHEEGGMRRRRGREGGKCGSRWWWCEPHCWALSDNW